MLVATLLIGSLVTVNCSPDTSQCEMKVLFRGDDFFEDIEWVIEHSGGEYFLGSSGYCGNQDLTMMINRTDYFEVSVTDSGSDGLCCGEDGDGGYLEILIDDTSVVRISQFDTFASANFSCESSSPVKITQDHSYDQSYNCLQPYLEEEVCGFSVTTDIGENNMMGWYILETSEFKEYTESEMESHPSTALAWNFHPHPTTTVTCTFTEGTMYSLVMFQMYGSNDIPDYSLLDPSETLILNINSADIAEFSGEQGVQAVLHNISCDSTSFDYSDLVIEDVPHIPSGEPDDFCRFTESFEESCKVDISFMSSTPSKEWTGDLYVYSQLTNQNDQLIHSYNNSDFSCYLPFTTESTKYSLGLSSEEGLLLPEDDYLIVKVDGTLLKNFTSVDSWAQLYFTCSDDGIELGYNEQNHYPVEEEEEETELVLFNCTMPGPPMEGYCSVVVELSTSSSDADWKTHWEIKETTNYNTEMVSYLTNATTECSLSVDGTYRFYLMSDDGVTPYMHEYDSLNVIVNGTLIQQLNRYDLANTHYSSNFEFECGTTEVPYVSEVDTTSCLYTSSSDEDMCNITVVVNTDRSPDEWNTYWSVSTFRHDHYMYSRDVYLDELTCYVPEHERVAFDVGTFSHDDDAVSLYPNESISILINGVEMYSFSDIVEYSYVTLTCDTVELGDEDVLNAYYKLPDHQYCIREEPGNDYCNVTIEMNSSSPDSWEPFVAYLGVLDSVFSFFSDGYLESYSCTLKRDEYAGLFIDYKEELSYEGEPVLKGDETVTVSIDGVQIGYFSHLAGPTIAVLTCDADEILPEDMIIDTPGKLGLTGSWCNSYATGEGFCDVTVELSTNRVNSAWTTYWEIAEHTSEAMTSGSNLQDDITCSLYSDRTYYVEVGSSNELVPALFGDESLTVKIDGVPVYTFSGVYGTEWLDITCDMAEASTEDIFLEANEALESTHNDACSYYECKDAGNDDRTCSPEDWQCDSIVTFSSIESASGLSWVLTETASFTVLSSSTTSGNLTVSTTLENDLGYSLTLTNGEGATLTGFIKVESGSNSFDIDLSEFSGLESMDIEFTCADISDLEHTLIVSEDSSSTVAESDSSFHSCLSFVIVLISLLVA